MRRRIVICLAMLLALCVIGDATALWSPNIFSTGKHQPARTDLPPHNDAGKIQPHQQWT